ESGSLITAGQALEENREVLAIPGPIWNETSRGTNALIKSGAKVCTCSQDVLEALSLDRPDLVAEARKNLPLDSTETEILSNLREPKHIDDIARMLELDAAAISAKMAMLEMKGYVKPMGGQVWIKTPGI
ncbi:MAG TPA: DNA-processing protein DprA, partial [Patescibacteria group bacterium]|nr:DNA-processing protein DprA [Patescibacteria group bacterium]